MAEKMEHAKESRLIYGLLGIWCRTQTACIIRSLNFDPLFPLYVGISRRDYVVAGGVGFQYEGEGINEQPK